MEDKKEVLPEENENELKEKTKEISVKEGAFGGINEGMGIKYISPFALALGANNTQIGLLSSLPSLLGNFSQLFTQKALEKMSRKKLLFYCALAQALMWIPVILVGLMFFVFNIEKVTPILLIVIYTLLIVFGSFYGPAWNSWMRDIVTEKSGTYFGFRNKIVNIVILISMLIGGFVLDYFENTKVFIGFIILFFIAFIARSISASLFLKKYEPKIEYQKEYFFSIWQFLERMPSNNFGKFVIFVALVQVTMAIAGPFFTVYLLKDLSFTYTQWMLVTVATFLSTFIFMPVWGKFADNYGNLKVVKICSFLIILIPLFWILSVYFKGPLLFYFIFTESFSGFAWAGFNLASSNFIYDAVTKQRMVICVAYSNVLAGIGVFIGATLGGILSSSNISFGIFNGILLVFLISFIGRLLVALIMFRKIKEVRTVKEFGFKDAKEKLLMLSPDNLIKQINGIIRLRP